MSSTPHSRASHHNSAVLVELRSTTGMNFPIPLTRSAKSLQLPSLSASSVMTRVPLRADSSRPEADLMLRAHRTVMPRGFNSFSMLGSGPLLATMMTALGSFLPGITSFTRLHASGAEFRIAVSYRKLLLCVYASRHPSTIELDALADTSRPRALRTLRRPGTEQCWSEASRGQI